MPATRPTTTRSARNRGRLPPGPVCLVRLSELDDEVRERCLFALVPDWPFSHERTMFRFRKYADVIRAFRLPVAFAIQDGATDATVPWEDFDVVFLAGTTEWKLSREAMNFAYRARARGKALHMGRVNSGDRLVNWASYIGCDSVDGTFMKHGSPADMVARLKSFLDADAPRLTQMAAAVI